MELQPGQVTGRRESVAERARFTCDHAQLRGGRALVCTYPMQPLAGTSNITRAWWRRMA